MALTLGGRRLRVLDVNPELARLWLEQTDTPNRRIQMADVNRYARAMKEGRWRPAGDPIRIDDRGHVLDGQHRLAAVIKAEVTIQFVVLDGANLDDQNAYDSGRTRKASQQLAMRGGWKNATTVASIARVVMQWHTNTLISGSYRPATDEIFDFAERWRPRLEESLAHAIAVGRSTSLSKSLTGGFAFTAYDQAATTPEKFSSDRVDQFLKLLASGAGLEENDPILILRNQAQRYGARSVREPEHIQLYRIVATWKAWVKGRRYTKLQVPPGSIGYDQLTLT